jgi:hypothetical protein
MKGLKILDLRFWIFDLQLALFDLSGACGKQVKSKI